MGEKNLFNQEKKWSVFIEHVDTKSMAAWVQNIGMTWNDIKRYFNLVGESNGFEMNITDHELKTLLNSVTTNCTVFAVVDAENHYNRDQKTLNQIKENREKLLEEKGYTIVNHTFSSSDIKTDSKETYEARSYLKLLVDRQDELIENIKSLKNEERKYNDAVRDLEIEFDCKKKDLEVEIDNKQKDLDYICERYKKGKEFVENQDAVIQKIKDENNSLFGKNNELTEQYIYLCNENDNLKVENKRLNNENSKAETSLAEMKERISQMKREIEDLETKKNTIVSTINSYVHSMMRNVSSFGNVKKLIEENN